MIELIQMARLIVCWFCIPCGVVAAINDDPQRSAILLLIGIAMYVGYRRNRHRARMLMPWSEPYEEEPGLSASEAFVILLRGVFGLVFLCVALLALFAMLKTHFSNWRNDGMLLLICFGIGMACAIWSGIPSVLRRRLARPASPRIEPVISDGPKTTARHLASWQSLRADTKEPPE